MGDGGTNTPPLGLADAERRTRRALTSLGNTLGVERGPRWAASPAPGHPARACGEMCLLGLRPRCAAADRAGWDGGPGAAVAVAAVEELAAGAASPTARALAARWLADATCHPVDPTLGLTGERRPWAGSPELPLVSPPAALLVACALGLEWDLASAAVLDSRLRPPAGPAAPGDAAAPGPALGSPAVCVSIRAASATLITALAEHDRCPLTEATAAGLDAAVAAALGGAAEALSAEPAEWACSQDCLGGCLERLLSSARAVTLSGARGPTPLPASGTAVLRCLEATCGVAASLVKAASAEDAAALRRHVEGLGDAIGEVLRDVDALQREAMREMVGAAGEAAAAGGEGPAPNEAARGRFQAVSLARARLKILRDLAEGAGAWGRPLESGPGRHPAWERVHSPDGGAPPAAPAPGWLEGAAAAARAVLTPGTGASEGPRWSRDLVLLVARAAAEIHSGVSPEVRGIVEHFSAAARGAPGAGRPPPPRRPYPGIWTPGTLLCVAATVGLPVLRGPLAGEFGRLAVGVLMGGGPEGRALGALLAREHGRGGALVPALDAALWRGAEEPPPWVAELRAALAERLQAVLNRLAGGAAGGDRWQPGPVPAPGGGAGRGALGVAGADLALLRCAALVSPGDTAALLVRDGCRSPLRADTIAEAAGEFPEIFCGGSLGRGAALAALALAAHPSRAGAAPQEEKRGMVRMAGHLTGACEGPAAGGACRAGAEMLARVALPAIREALAGAPPAAGGGPLGGLLPALTVARSAVGTVAAAAQRVASSLPDGAGQTSRHAGAAREAADALGAAVATLGALTRARMGRPFGPLGETLVSADAQGAAEAAVQAEREARLALRTCREAAGAGTGEPGGPAEMGETGEPEGPGGAPGEGGRPGQPSYRQAYLEVWGLAAAVVTQGAAGVADRAAAAAGRHPPGDLRRAMVATALHLGPCLTDAEADEVLARVLEPLARGRGWAELGGGPAGAAGDPPAALRAACWAALLSAGLDREVKDGDGGAGDGDGARARGGATQVLVQRVAALVKRAGGGAGALAWLREAAALSRGLEDAGGPLGPLQAAGLEALRRVGGGEREEASAAVEGAAGRLVSMWRLALR